MNRAKRIVVAFLLPIFLFTTLVPNVAFAQDAQQADPRRSEGESNQEQQEEQEQPRGHSTSDRDSRGHSSDRNQQGKDPNDDPQKAEESSDDEAQAIDEHNDQNQQRGHHNSEEDENAIENMQILMADDGNSGLYTPDNHNKPDPLATQKKLYGNLQIGEFTGAAIYEYPIVLPKGRNGLTPQLALTYNSNEQNYMNTVGYKWNLTEFYIRRMNKKGVERMYDDNYFITNTPFSSGELAAIDLSDEKHGLYGEKVENSFAKYEFQNDNSWLVTDKFGTQYKFGLTEQSRMFDPEDAERIYEWRLEEVRDTNDNFMRYTYKRYANDLYPERIFYGGHGSTNGPFEVHFPKTTGHNNTFFSYAPGFRLDSTRHITGIEIFVNGQMQKKYNLEYHPNDVTVMWTLKEITETAYDQDGNSKTLPPTKFEYTQTEVSWEEQDVYYPEGVNWLMASCNSYGDCGWGGKNVLHWDMTGDSLPDFEYITGSNPYFNARATNDAKGNWIIENNGTYIGDNPSPAYDNSIPKLNKKLIDFNGDGRLDIASSSQQQDGSVSSWINITNGTNLSNVIPFGMSVSQISKPDHGVAIGDLNGDGLPDMIQGESYPGSTNDYQTCLNIEGKECELTDFWISQKPITEYIKEWVQNRTGFLTDCNLDGLADMKYSSYTGELYINDGRGGWLTDVSNGPGKDACLFGAFLESNTNRAIDVNGDGLIDSVYAAHEYNPSGSFPVFKSKVTLRKPATFGEPVYEGIFPIPMGYAGQNEKDYGVRLIDLNGDLLPDVIQSFKEWDNITGESIKYKKVFMHTGSRPHLLKTITTPQAAEINLEYSTSAQYIKEDGTQANPNLPIIVTTVDKVTVNDGLGTESSVDYFYEDGHYHFNHSYDRGFAGFRVVSQTDATGIKTKTHFHQSENSIQDSANGEFEDHYSKRGNPYRIETYDPQGNIVQSQINKWTHEDLGNKRYRVGLNQSVSQIHTPNTGIVKSTARSFEYDEFGNTTSLNDYGEVNANNNAGDFTDIGDDLIKVENKFTNNTINHLVGFISEQKSYDKNNQLLTHIKRFYDDLSTQSATKGNLTRHRAFSNTLISMGNWIVTDYTYNNYGLPLTEKNPKGFITTTTYDSNNFYPASVTNPKGHTINFVYDLATGKPLEITDANGTKILNKYDGFGRIVEVKKSNQADSNLINIIATTTYNDDSIPQAIQSKTYYSNIDWVESWQYQDGLGRTVQTRQEGSNGKWIESSTFYDERGNVKKITQPSFTNTSVFAAADFSELGNTFAYDTLGRVISVTNALGSTNTNYNGWTQTVNDPNGNIKEYEHDARGNLIKVKEHNGSQVYETNYTYDAVSNLIKIVDEEDNVREFTYNSIGQRLTQTLPYKTGNEPSKWSYDYDLNGNLINRTNAKNESTNYEYDELDRLTTEKHEEQNKLIYIYDQGENAIGRLSEINGENYQRNYTYDLWGRVLQDTKTIEQETFEHAFTYDWMDGVTTMTYPNDLTAIYLYNNAHLLSKIQVEDKVFSDNFEYSPLGQITKMKLGNNVVVNNAYDPNKLYRLTDRDTTLNGNVLQNFNYNYDAVGNLLTLNDTANGPSAKTVNYQYDDIYRLTQANYSSVASGPQPTQIYTYSPTGNILNKNDLGNFNYNSIHPHAVTQAGEHTFAYDANGNMIERDGEVMEYDYRDRLIQSGDKVSFAYGESYERVSKTNLETGNIQYYASQYYEKDDSKESSYIFAGDLKIGKVEVEIVPPITNAETPVVSGFKIPYTPHYLFSGTKLPELSLWINGNEIMPLDSESNWIQKVTLAKGINNFHFYTKNSEGEESEKVTEIIEYQLNPPTVNPVENPTSSSQVTLSGSKMPGASIWINNELKVPSLNDSALQGHWSFNEGSGAIALDQTENETNLTITNASYAPGIDGTALNFTTNTAQAFSSTIPNGMKIGTDDSFGIAVWVKTTSNGERIIVDTRKNGYIDHFILIRQASGSSTAEFIIDGLTGGNTKITGNTPINDGKWHLIEAIRDTSTNTIRLKVDGLEDAAPVLDTTTGAITDTNSDWRIGKHYSLNSVTWAGKIDEVRFYSIESESALSYSTQWSTTIDLQEGENSIKVAAKDSVGQSSSPIWIDINYITQACPNGMAEINGKCWLQADFGQSCTDACGSKNDPFTGEALTCNAEENWNDVGCNICTGFNEGASCFSDQSNGAPNLNNYAPFYLPAVNRCEYRYEDSNLSCDSSNSNRQRLCQCS